VDKCHQHKSAPVRVKESRMFRSQKPTDEGGFVNEGLEVSEDNGGSDHQKFDIPSTKIEITRSKYDQQRLHDEMKYKKPPSKPSSE
jgi:hypothetical protein